MWVKQTVVPLEFDLADRLARKITALAGTFLVNQGEPNAEFFYLHSGLIRAVYVSPDGSERIKEFYFAGEFCFLFLSWLLKEPARYSLQAISDCVYSPMPVHYLDTPAGAALAQALMRQQLIYKERKEELLLLNAPEQRYQYILQHFPQWGELLTQRDIASYLGMTSVSLSRIKARLNKG